jgi:hypothetical protein
VELTEPGLELLKLGIAREFPARCTGCGLSTRLPMAVLPDDPWAG